MGKKTNSLAEECVGVAMRQLSSSYHHKLQRLHTIRKYRRLYNTQVERKLRQQFNVPLPVFAGMVDTLQADLNDELVIEYEYTDPADYKAIQKANAAIKKESRSARPGAQWEHKFQAYRFEKILTGRGVLKFGAENTDGFKTLLEHVVMEDFHCEPTGGGDLENHLFAGQENVMRTRSQLEKGAKDGLYDTEQVKKLTQHGTSGEKSPASFWSGDYDLGNRYRPLGLDPSGNNYVGEEVWHLCEWVLEYKGRRWYLLFDPYSATWVRFEKNSDVCSADYFPWLSSASHRDEKNFWSKAFADDLYPIADSVITLFNQDLTNRSKRNINARAYDRAMFKNPEKLDEAQYRPDALVPVETFGGTRRISEGIYSFDTPEITGTIDLIDWLQRDTGKQLGVNEMQQGAAQPASKKVGVTYAEMTHISKRLAFTASPFVNMGQQLGQHFLVALKDYMTEPMSVQLLGETGIEWDVMRRVDLSTKRALEVTVSSAQQRNNESDAERANRMQAFELTAQSENVNYKMRDELIFREIGGFSEHDIAMLLDPSVDTDKETAAEVSAAIQEIVVRSRKPKRNFNADRYFVKRLMEFATKHKDTLTRKKFDLLMEYAEEHIPLVRENVEREAKLAAMMERQQTPLTGPTAPGATRPQRPTAPGAPAMPQRPPTAMPQM